MFPQTLVDSGSQDNLCCRTLHSDRSTHLGLHARVCSTHKVTIQNNIEHSCASQLFQLWSTHLTWAWNI